MYLYLLISWAPTHEQRTKVREIHVIESPPMATRLPHTTHKTPKKSRSIAVCFAAVIYVEKNFSGHACIPSVRNGRGMDAWKDTYAVRKQVPELVVPSDLCHRHRQLDR